LADHATIAIKPSFYNVTVFIDSQLNLNRIAANWVQPFALVRRGLQWAAMIRVFVVVVDVVSKSLLVVGLHLDGFVKIADSKHG